jgi:hypothetical protein
MRLVQEPLYRSLNLDRNNIYLRGRFEQYPEHIASLVDKVCKGRGHDSLTPTLEQLEQDTNFLDLALGAVESIVERYLRCNLFTESTLVNGLHEAGHILISKYHVPDTRSHLKVSVPEPDLLYGYKRKAFINQKAQLSF